MRINEIKAFFDYTYWATERLLDAASSLSVTKLDRDVAGRLVQQPAKHNNTGQQKHRQTQHPVE
ncbi:hypothetical protein KSD_85730 [Ktedonobacter sp. SOSP1-85]|nr:hypothetical protein KSD_85730 [Ktedonobacter sp. SOSP1-85]